MKMTPSQAGLATYCPEDNKLRLYVGRVPRDEYEALRAEGWTSTPKQSEAGQGDFSATWTPERRNTALAYSPDGIADEDASPEERAADRAERFGGYRDKRLNEATGHADRYDAQPHAHGYQSPARADRAAARHDRIGTRAVDSWDKAEYWTRRTAGVIAHALYKSRPDVRMGRIKELEAELRKRQKDRSEWRDAWLKWQKVAGMEDSDKKRQYVEILSGYMHSYDWRHPRPETVTNTSVLNNGSSLYTLLNMEKYGYGSDDITAAEACQMFFERFPNEPQTETEWTRHLQLRLAYESQMLDAQGGRAAFVEMEPGGWIGKHQIHKVTKSPATGRVVSVEIRFMSDTNRWGNAWPDGKGARERAELINVERMGADVYRPPTDEERAEWAAKVAGDKKAKAKAAKAKADAGENCPLINPTDEDAERLQSLLNEHGKERHDASQMRQYRKICTEYKPSTVCRITQSQYSAVSKGAYARAETRGLCRNGEIETAFSNMWTSHAAAEAKRRGPKVCTIRTTGSDGDDYGARRVIVLTDKPQKPLPAAVWEPIALPELANA